MERTSSNTRLNHTSALYAVILVLFSIVIGLGLLLVWPGDTDRPPREQQTAVASLTSSPVPRPQPQRWFVWEGAAPMLGDPYASGDECEAARHFLVTNAEREAEAALQALPPMTMRQIQAIGNPAEEILAELNRIRSAYCRLESGL